MQQYYNLPQELREKGKFNCWRYVPNPKKEKPDKVPFNPNTGGQGQSSNPGTFTDFQTALAAVGKYDGLGIGILNATGGAEVAATIDEISYDDVIALYFSVKPEYRKNAVWLMNDKTALALRTLKDNAGNYLWRDNDDTILGKKVIMSEFMPDAEPNNKPIAFGDFSYYWVIGRSPIGLRTLTEKFALLDQIGYLAYEFLDGKLVRPEAVKVIQIKTP